jgi:hypothetical protein
MRFLKYAALLGVLIFSVTNAAHAQVAVRVGVGPIVGAVGAEPACAYGYYPAYPYACAPYGYWGPNYFVSGVFIGVGPWYHSHWRPAYYGHGYYGRPGYGWRPGYGYARSGYGYYGAPARGFVGGGNYGHGGGYHDGGYRGGGGHHSGGNAGYHGGGGHGGPSGGHH